MAVRIYSLAKELKVDSKELVDICTKVGIRGKGSALASLSDEEVAKLKDHFKGPSPRSLAPSSAGSAQSSSSRSVPLAPGKPTRPAQSGVSRTGKMPVIITPRDVSSTSGSQSTLNGLAQEGPSQEGPSQEGPSQEGPSQEGPSQEGGQQTIAASGESVREAVTSESDGVAGSTIASPAKSQISAPDGPISGVPTGTKEVSGPDDPSGDDLPASDHLAGPATDGPRAPGPLARVMRRDDYIGPGSTSGRPPALEESAPSDSRKAKPDATPLRARPAVKLAPMPNAVIPKSVTPSNEPAAQKPDMKLPADALRASRSGLKPLAAHLRRHEQNLDEAKRRDDGTGTEERSGRRVKSGKVQQGTEGKTPMLGGREQRQLKRQRQGQRRGGGRFANRSMRRTRRSGISTAAPRKGKVSLQLPCTVRELSEAAGVPAAQILRILMQEGVMTTITSVMDADLTELVAEELSLELDFKSAVSFEDQVLEEILHREDRPEDLDPRPPVITFLGHVDHGKTSLLDKIINIDVVSGESGGITQHIRAYTVNKEGKQLSFVDTPGHEAFTEMRARGADVTDIAVLVVAADDGVMPQTEEAISHAKVAEVPIVVALNKSDLPGVDINRAMQGLSANELLPSEWGGDVEVIKTSAITGDGIDELLDTLLTVAELHEYKANSNRDALGTCLEAQQETGRGVVAKVIVQNGTLKVGDIIVCGQAHGRVKAMYDTLETEKRLQEAGPSVPVNLTGLNVAPAAGEHFYVLDDIAQARSIAEARADAWREVSLGDAMPHVTLENLFDRLEAAGDVQILNIILRADVRGSIEAIRKELEKLEHPEVKIKILQATVGGITEADVTLADASDAIILGFNVVPEEGARYLAEQRGVQIRRYEVIYKITEDLKAALEGLLKPEEHEVDLGRALVQLIFKISRIGTVAGCRVLAGKIERNSRARIIRDNTIIGDYPIDTLRREKDDAKEVREGLECGIKMSGFNDVKEGDLLEVYRIEEKSRSFDD